VNVTSGEPLTRFSGLETLTIRPDSNFQMIGERTNVTGSAKFASRPTRCAAAPT
jgi:5-methyltetrahydrofolate--homocysteine methyltransferase